MSVGVLGVPGSPLLSHTLYTMLAHKVPVSAVFLDSKGWSEKETVIWQERTRGRLPLLDFSGANGVPFYFVKSHNDTATSQLVDSLKIKVLINGGTPRILKEEMLKAPELGVLNIHPGRLPDYRGCTCLEWAIYNDEQIVNSVHFMTKKIDDGPVVLTEGYYFSPREDYSDIRVEVYQSGFALLAKATLLVLKQALSIDKLPMNFQPGQYYQPMPSDKLMEVKRKLAVGEYKFQSKKEFVLSKTSVHDKKCSLD